MATRPQIEPAPPSALGNPRFESYAHLVWRRFLHHRVAVVAAIVLLLIMLAAVLAPWVTPYPLGQPDLSAILAPPSIHHPMGTDDLGIDLFTEVLFGGRVSLTIGIFAALVAVVVGGAIGSISGYFGGLVDALLMRVTDVGLSVPLLFVVLLLSLLIGPTPVSIITIIGLTSWMYPARIVRSQFLTLKKRDFVEAARAVGMHSTRIILREIFPNAMAPLIVNATLLVGQAIILESVMSFLGAGLTPPNISWGYLLNQAQSFTTSAPWLAIFPGLMIFFVVLAVNLVGDGLRDALDPTSNQRQ